MSLHSWNDLRVAAFLAHPMAYRLSSDFWPSVSVSNSILEYLVSNKVLYRTFSNSEAFRYHQVYSDLEHLIKNSRKARHEYFRYRNLKREILETIDSLNGAGIETAFIKSSESLPLDSDNFDLLLHQDDVRRTHRFLIKNGFSEVKIYSEPFKILYRKTKSCKDYVALHLHTKIAWWGVEFVNAEQAWRHLLIKKVDDVTLRFLKPEFHIPVTLAHAFYENASFKLSDLLYVFDSLYRKREEINFPKLCESAKELGWEYVFNAMLMMTNLAHKNIYQFEITNEDALERLILKEFGDRIFQESKQLISKMAVPSEARCLPLPLPFSHLRRRHFIFQTVRSMSLSFSERLFHMLFILLSVLKVRKDESRALFCVMGMDGSGKTTHVNKLAKDFAKRGYSTCYTWTRETSLFLKNFMNLVSKAGDTDKVDNPTREKLKRYLYGNPALRKIWITALIFDYQMGLRLITSRKKLKSQVVIFDRWAFDKLLDNLHDVPPESSFFRFMERLCITLSPRSDFQVILRSRPEDLLARKSDELNRKIILEKNRLYDLFSKRNGVYQIDTHECVDSVHLEILELALKAFYKGENKRQIFKYDVGLKLVPIGWPRQATNMIKR